MSGDGIPEEEFGKLFYVYSWTLPQGNNSHSSVDQKEVKNIS